MYALVLATYHVRPGSLPYRRLMKLYTVALRLLKAQRAPAASSAASTEDANWQWALNARDNL